MLNRLHVLTYYKFFPHERSHEVPCDFLDGPYRRKHEIC